MKSIKLILLTIVLLFSCSISYCTPINNAISSTGKLDSVEISITDIKVCNEKLIERKYYIKINNEQDSIINYQRSYIEEQKLIIDDMQHRVLECNKINENINKQYDKERKKTVILGSVVGTVLVCTVVSVVFNCIKK